jgi:regulator of replication initiation timing
VIKDLEQKIQFSTLEIGKKANKINQMISNNHILQSQIEHLRGEIEEEKLSVSREISHLNAIISEKNSIIERLRAEGTFEADKQVFEAGLTLESTTGFDSTLETDLEPSFDPTGILFDSTNKEPQTKLSPRNQALEGSGPTDILLHLGSYIKRGSFQKNDSETIIPPDIDQPLISKAMVEKGTQTEPLENNESLKKVIKAAELVEQKEHRRKSVTEAISKADQERFLAFEAELKEAQKQVDFYKKICSEKDLKIEQLYDTMKSMSDENSKIINELTMEFEQASSMLRKSRSM